MRYPASEKLEIIRLVEEGHLSARQTLAKFGIPRTFEVFSTSWPDSLGDWYDVRACSADGSVLKTDSGFQIVCQYTLDSLDWASTIIVPGWHDTDAVPSSAILYSLRNANARGCRIVSLCSGAFVLAHAGLLDGKRATTHWRWSSKFRTLFPEVKLEAQSLFQQSDNIFTSGRSAAALDLCLALVEQDCGIDTALEVSRRVIMPLRRNGNQAQFFGSTRGDSMEERFKILEGFVRENLEEQIGVPKLAELAGMTERTLLRRFNDHYDITPAKWLRRQRMFAARSLMRDAHHSIGQIASDVGFQDLPSFVAAFKKEFQMTPSSYRKSLIKPKLNA